MSSRAEVYWPATVIWKEQVLQGRIKNLSRGGALIYLEEQIGLQDNIRIAIEIPKYNYVISAKGEVVRTVALEKDTEEYSFAAGVKFTEISDEDLKFFTGNLAPEWQKDYQEPEITSPSMQKFNRNIIYALLGVVIFSFIFYTFGASKSKKVDSEQIAAVENRLEVLESQLTILNETSLWNGKTEEQLQRIHDELSDIKKNFVTVAAVEQLRAELQSRQDKNFALLRIAIEESSLALEKTRKIEEPEVVEEPKIAEASEVLETPEPAEKPEPAELPAKIEKIETPQIENTDAGRKTIKATKVVKPAKPAQQAAAAKPIEAVYHVVQKGENLYRISLKYGLTVDELRKLNNLPPDTSIQPSQKLLVK
jgi:LysM repeat protein